MNGYLFRTVHTACFMIMKVEFWIWRIRKNVLIYNNYHQCIRIFLNTIFKNIRNQSFCTMFHWSKCFSRDKLFCKDWNQEALDTSVPETDECSPYTDWTADGSTINVNRMFQWVNRIEHVMNHVGMHAYKMITVLCRIHE